MSTRGFGRSAFIRLAATICALLALLPARKVAGADGAELANQRPIKVGVIISNFSATGQGWFNKPTGYGYTNKAFREGLLDPSFDLCPVIEPGTSEAADLVATCTKYFPGRKPIECNDATRMGELEVIVAPFVLNATPEMLDAVEHAVRDNGKGLVIRGWFGAKQPNFTPQVQRVNGLTEGFHAWNPKDVECKIVASHPILGELSGQTAATIRLEPNGAHGVLNGHPLILVPSLSDITPRPPTPTTEPTNYVFAPLFIAHLGKGRIVNCAWLGHDNAAATARTLREISVRSVQWAAGRLPERPGDVGAEEGL